MVRTQPASTSILLQPAEKPLRSRPYRLVIPIVILHNSLPLVRSLHLVLKLTSSFKRGLGDQATCTEELQAIGSQTPRSLNYVLYYAHLRTYIPYYDKHSVLGEALT